MQDILKFLFKNSCLFKEASNNGKDMLKNGKAPNVGEIMKMPKLAQTLRKIVDKCRDGFYKGYVAQSIAQLIQSKGALMTLEDLSEHRSTNTC
jgi:gamma-glutamyltranspeptidase/glutathione hydrolase